jgi:drug/metabolite transporter (DMT)-like permease
LTRAWLLLVGLVIVWGSHWVVVKVGLETIPPFTYGVLRLAGGIIVLAALMAATGRLKRPERPDWPIIVSYGLLAVALGIAMMNLALPHIPAGRSSILAYTIPLWVVPVMLVAARVLPTRAEVLGLALGLVGLVLLLNPVAIDWGSEGALLGSLLLVAGALGAAVALVHVRTHPWKGTPFDTQIWQLLVALLPMVVLWLLLERDRIGEIRWDVPTALAVLYSGPLATAFAFWASQMIVKALGPLTTGIGYLGAPVVGVIAGIIVLGEALGPLDLLGILVTGVAIVIVLLARRPRSGTGSGSTPRKSAGPGAELRLPDGADLPAPTPLDRPLRMRSGHLPAPSSRSAMTVPSSPGIGALPTRHRVQTRPYGRQLGKSSTPRCSGRSSGLSLRRSWPEPSASMR